MSKATQQINCLSRLHALTGQIDSIVVFLLHEKLITEDIMNKVRNSSEQAKDVQILLRRLQVADQLQLLEYNWQLLPSEYIRIYIITDREQKEFTYG